MECQWKSKLLALNSGLFCVYGCASKPQPADRQRNYGKVLFLSDLKYAGTAYLSLGYKAVLALTLLPTTHLRMAQNLAANFEAPRSIFRLQNGAEIDIILKRKDGMIHHFGSIHFYIVKKGMVILHLLKGLCT